MSLVEGPLSALDQDLKMQASEMMKNGFRIKVKQVLMMCCLT